MIFAGERTHLVQVDWHARNIICRELPYIFTCIVSYTWALTSALSVTIDEPAHVVNHYRFLNFYARKQSHKTRSLHANRKVVYVNVYLF